MLVPIEFVMMFFSIMGVLLVYIWSGQEKKIARIEKIQGARPCDRIYACIKEIKLDILWIKRELDKK